MSQGIRRSLRLWTLAGACLAVACGRARPFVPASSAAASFSPAALVSKVAQREGLTAALRVGGGCSGNTTNAAGGPTLTEKACTIAVEFKDRTDAARLTRSLFAEMEQVVSSSTSVSLGRSGSADLGEMHLSGCTGALHSDSKTSFQGCLFLHAYAVQKGDKNLTYTITLDEDRWMPPPRA
jgi:hypothetical protein